MNVDNCLFFKEKVYEYQNILRVHEMAKCTELFIEKIVLYFFRRGYEIRHDVFRKRKLRPLFEHSVQFAVRV